MTDIKFECDGKIYYLKQEDVTIQRLCDVEYHKAYVQAMKDGLLPRASLEQLIRDKDIWTEEQEVKLSEYQNELNVLVNQLENTKDLTIGLEIAKKIAILRARIMLVLEARNSVFQSSCEFCADQVRREAYLAHAIYTDSGEKVYKTYNDFVIQRDSPIALSAMNALIQFISETFQKTIDGLPENKILNKAPQTQEAPVSVQTELISKPKRKRKTKAEVAVS